MRDLQCDKRTLAGPVDPRVVAWLSKRYPLDPDYLACMNHCHGGEPRIGTVRVVGRAYRLALFLTLVDLDTKLPGPPRPHFEDRLTDERVVNSVVMLMDSECNTSRSLFTGLVPFAATEGKNMCLDRGYVDLFCFDYRAPAPKPPVVLWDAGKAMDAYFEWDRLPFEEQFDENDNCLSVPWDTFLIPVATSFGAFLEMLTPNE